MRRSLVLVLCCLFAAGCGGATRVAAPASVPHIDPYAQGVAFARCMRAHGVPHPNPDRNGDFQLTPAQEARMRTAGPRKHETAEKACFHLLKGTVSTKPLSKEARQAALGRLRELKRCLHGYGYEVGRPLVRNLSRGRAMFGFSRSSPPPADAQARARLQNAQHTCERKVKLAKKIDAIVKVDRGEGY